MSTEETSTNAKHLVTTSGNADHGGYSFVLLIFTFWFVCISLGLIILARDAFQRDIDVWKAMRTCPPAYTRILTDKGELKDCLLTDRLATPIATPSR